MKSLAAILLAAIAIVTASCARESEPVARAAPPDTTATDLKAIRAAGELGFDALKAGDAASVAAFYSEDAILMPANSPYVVGRTAIKEQFGAELSANKAAGIALILDETDIGVSGTLAWRSGTFLGTGPDGKPLNSGKFLQVWEKQADGLWQITHGMFNFDAPRGEPPRRR